MTTVDNWPVEISLREEDGQTRAEAWLTRDGAAAVAPEPGRDSRPFAGSGMKSDDVGRIMGAQCEHVVALRPRPTGDG